ncbi:MAG: replicative DNA helicase [alpha proteobacterium MED-G10]|nr:MAG: replicative DNA helicase [alpha proteobacterium MED-G10]|tara:strand:- start:288 stop:1748 length:1461 start_codon:yes stop_codon:yes gene_type:complete
MSDQSSKLTNFIPKESTPISREAPMNIGAEQALLGAIISNNLALEKVENFLEPQHFSSKINGLIFKTLKKLISNDQVADLNTLKIFLENDDDFIDNGGMSYLLKISENSISIINSKQYGELIYDLFIRRKLINLGTNLINESYENFEEQDSNEIIENIESNLFNLTNEGETQKGPKQFDNILEDTLEYAEKAFKKSEDVVGLKTGLNDFDKKIGGLHRSDLIIVAGRPSMGKTAFATNIASNICNNKKSTKKTNVLFFSLEMSSEQLATRILSEISKISSEGIRTGNLSKNEFEKLIKSSENLKDLSLFIDDSPALTISSIRTRSRRLKRKQGLDLIIIDYLQLLSGESRNLNDNRVKEISDITRGLKAIAKELNIPIVALSQLSRKVEDREEKRPQLADLRESGSIEQDADLVVFLYREEYYLARTEPPEGTEKHIMWTSKMEKVHNIAEAIVAKHRHGPISRVKLHFSAANTKFSDLADTQTVD